MWVHIGPLITCCTGSPMPGERPCMLESCSHTRPLIYSLGCTCEDLSQTRRRRDLNIIVVRKWVSPPISQWKDTYKRPYIVMSQNITRYVGVGVAWLRPGW